MVHYPEKFRELHEHFLDAHAKYDSLKFHLEAHKSYKFYFSHFDKYDFLCYTGLPPDLSIKLAVFVSKCKEFEEPYREFKELATRAWTFLPDTIKRPIVETMPEAWADVKPEYDYEYWVDFVFFLLAQRDWRNPPPEINEPNYRPPVEVLIEPFKFSADVILLCRLGTDEPKNPYALKPLKPEVLPAQSQDEKLADEDKGTQGKTNDKGKASTSEKPPKSQYKIHESSEEIPGEYKDKKTGDPFGPLIGNKVELGYAIHPNADTTSESQLRRYLTDVLDNRVWLRNAQGGNLEAYFKIKSDWETCAKKLTERRSN